MEHLFVAHDSYRIDFVQKLLIPPSPHKNVQSYSDNPFVKLSKNVVIFLLHFPLKKTPSPHFGQIPKESVFFTHVLIPSSSVAKIRELYPEEDGKYMGYKRKKND